METIKFAAFEYSLAIRTVESRKVESEILNELTMLSKPKITTKRITNSLECELTLMVLSVGRELLVILADQIQGVTKSVMSYDAPQRKKSPFFAPDGFVFASCDKFAPAAVRLVML